MSTTPRNELEIVGTMFRFAYGRFGTALLDSARRAKLSATEARALRALVAEWARTPTELSRYLMITPTAVANAVDRLEERELVRRAPDSADRRRLALEVTPKGLRVADAVWGEILARLDRAWHELDPQDQEDFRRTAPKVLQALERQFGASAAETEP